MARRRRLLLAAGVLAALAVLVVTRSPQQTRYVPRTLFSAAYGSGAGDVGLLQAAGTVVYGPQGFLALPGGRLAVLDTWNHRLLEVDAHGSRLITPLPAAPLIRGEQLALSPTGAYLLADNHVGQVLVMGQGGESATVYPGANSPAVDLRIIRGMVQSGPFLYLSVLEATSRSIRNLLLRISSSGRLPLEGRLPARGMVVGMAPSAGGKLLLLLSLPGRREELASLSASGKPTVLWPVAAGLTLLGSDHAGAIFLLGKGQVLVYGPRGHLQTRFAVPRGSGIRISQQGSVSASGVVYLAEAGRQHYRIVAYHPQTHRDWRLF